MGKKIFNVTRKARDYFVLCAVLFIAPFLLVAAYGKLFYPVDTLEWLDRGVACFELAFLIFLFIFRKKKWAWLAGALLFASWGGYALFWYSVELPCSCMGEWLELPTLYMLLLDLLFVEISFGAAWLLKAERWLLYATLLAALFAILCGYASADWVYNTLVLLPD